MKQRQELLNESEFNGSFLHKKLLIWYDRHERPLPWRVLWKKHRDPWHVWVSEIMLQQTVIKAVIPVYERFLTKYPSPLKLAKASSDEIRLAVRGLGYYRRFDLLHKACIKLESEKRPLPNNHDDWLDLPGVGPYTAAAIASITADEPYGVVDGNVERVLCRLLDIRSEPNLPHLKRQFKVLMNDLAARGNPGAVNQAVMELGQTICTPVKPNCPKCPVAQICMALKNSSQHLAPAPKVKFDSVDVSLQLNVLIYRDKILLSKRPDDAKFLKSTWGFPTNIASGTKFLADGSSTKVNPTIEVKSIGSIKHSITKHKITAQVMVGEYKGRSIPNNYRLVDPKTVEQNLVSNLDRKAWTLLQKSGQFT